MCADGGALIPQFYAGRSVLITGATGFIGKVLVERLLATCPDIGCLHLLLREKKGVSADTRLQELKDSEVFEALRARSPGQLDKLRALGGDISQPGLGVSPDALATLRQVSVVFHSAASLNFAEALHAAAAHNVRAVAALLAICDQLPHMQAFVHVSTAYCQAELARVEERVYAAPAPPAQLLAALQLAPPALLAPVTAKIIAPKPNTYLFTKAMAENIVESHGNRGYPVAIFRPTIVISAMRDPAPGWIESLNGPSGLVVAGGKGFLHVFQCVDDYHPDLLPVDICVDSLVAASWDTALDNPRSARVYNCSVGENPTSWRDFVDRLRVHLRRYPMDGVLWYPTGIAVESGLARKVMEFLLHTVPLHTLEYVLKVIGVVPKMSLIKINQKLKLMGDVLYTFSVRQWDFPTDNLRRLRARLSAQDSAIYNLDPRTIDWDAQYKDFVRGTRKYLLHEKDEDLEKARRHVERMRRVHYGALAALAALLLAAAWRGLSTLFTV